LHFVRASTEFNLIYFALRKSFLTAAAKNKESKKVLLAHYLCYLLAKCLKLIDELCPAV